MNFKKEVLDKKNLININEISFDEFLKDPESEKVKFYIYHFNYLMKLKIFIKRFLIDFVNLFLKKKKIYAKNRSIEEVKAKYDKISGSYVQRFYNHETKKNQKLKKKKFIAYNHHENKIYSIEGAKAENPTINLISKFCDYYSLKSLIEIGAGELTTLYPIIKKTKNLDFISALDLSSNRLKHGKKFLDKRDTHINHLVAANATSIPYEDNSFDISFTQHCIEQMPQHIVKKIINEMIRISSKYIIIVEPSYQFSNKITRNRILHKGYPILSDGHFKNSNCNIIYRDGLPFSSYVFYSEITILEKIKKEESKPILRNPTNYKKIKLEGDHKIFDFSKT